MGEEGSACPALPYIASLIINLGSSEGRALLPDDPGQAGSRPTAPARPLTLRLRHPSTGTALCVGGKPPIPIQWGQQEALSTPQFGVP